MRRKKPSGGAEARRIIEMLQREGYLMVDETETWVTLTEKGKAAARAKPGDEAQLALAALFGARA